MILFHFIHCKRDLYGPHFNLYSVFLGVAAAIVSWLLFFGLGNVQRLFNLLYYVFGDCTRPPKLLFYLNWSSKRNVTLPSH